MSTFGVAGFDGEYIDGGNVYLYMMLHELLPNEREYIIPIIKNQNPIVFEYFKIDCSAGIFSDVEVDSPRKHTPEELEKIKEDLMYFLFDIPPF